jgi:hypothetical protein
MFDWFTSSYTFHIEHWTWISKGRKKIVKRGYKRNKYPSKEIERHHGLACCFLFLFSCISLKPLHERRNQQKSSMISDWLVLAVILAGVPVAVLFTILRSLIRDYRCCAAIWSDATLVLYLNFTIINLTWTAGRTPHTNHQSRYSVPLLSYAVVLFVCLIHDTCSSMMPEVKCFLLLRLVSIFGQLLWPSC